MPYGNLRLPYANLLKTDEVSKLSSYLRARQVIARELVEFNVLRDWLRTFGL